MVSKASLEKAWALYSEVSYASGAQAGALDISGQEVSEFIKGIGKRNDEFIIILDIDRVFTKFFRSEKAIRTKTDKSGLGLFIVKNIVNQHEGKVFIDSEEGSGTEVWFTLPTQARLREAT